MLQPVSVVDWVNADFARPSLNGEQVESSFFSVVNSDATEFSVFEPFYGTDPPMSAMAQDNEDSSFGLDCLSETPLQRTHNWAEDSQLFWKDVQNTLEPRGETQRDALSRGTSQRSSFVSDLDSEDVILPPRDVCLPEQIQTEPIMKGICFDSGIIRQPSPMFQTVSMQDVLVHNDTDLDSIAPIDTIDHKSNQQDEGSSDDSMSNISEDEYKSPEERSVMQIACDCNLFIQCLDSAADVDSSDDERQWKMKPAESIKKPCSPKAPKKRQPNQYSYKQEPKSNQGSDIEQARSADGAPLKNEDGSQRNCVDCLTLETPLWRKDATGAFLCNRCGIRRKRAKNRNQAYIPARLDRFVPLQAKPKRTKDRAPGCAKKSPSLPAGKKRKHAVGVTNDQTFQTYELPQLPIHNWPPMSPYDTSRDEDDDISKGAFVLWSRELHAPTLPGHDSTPNSLSSEMLVDEYPQEIDPSLKMRPKFTCAAGANLTRWTSPISRIMV